METRDEHALKADHSDNYLNSFTSTLALVAASESGVLARLDRGVTHADELILGIQRGSLLLWMLEQSGILIREPDGKVKPGAVYASMSTEDREALVARARFTLLAAEDILAGRKAFFGQTEAFFARARTFSFFCYGRARDTNLSNIQDTETWVEYVAALNRAEAPHLAPLLPLEGCASVLEIGGNAGGFALQMLSRAPELRACILDLPAVCEIGRRRTAGAANADRLSFVAGDATRDVWPEVAGAAAEMVCFKSVLHDWDAANASAMIARAAGYLPARGCLAIVERGPVESAENTTDFSLAANLVFSGFYRAPEWYEDACRAAGLADISRRSVTLDLPFHVITARKPA